MTWHAMCIYTVRYSHYDWCGLEHLSTGCSNWMFVGATGSTDSVDLSDATTAAGSFSGYCLGSGSLTVGSNDPTSGMLWLGADTGGLGTLNIGGGTLESALSANLDVTTLVNLSGAGIIDIDNGQSGNFEATAPISGGGGLFITGGDTFALSGTNNYTVGTTVADGELILSSSSAIKDGTRLTVGSPLVFAAPIVPSLPAVASPLSDTLTPVPELGACALLMMAIGALPLFRRRRF